MPPSTWTGAADRDMLLTIIEEGGTAKTIPWPQVARALQAKGYTFSHEACRQHFQKLKKLARDGSTVGPASSSPANDSGTNSANSSPTLQRKIATPRKSSAPKMEAGYGTPSRRPPPPPTRTVFNLGDMDDEEEDLDLPPRPVRPTPPAAKRQRVVKNEERGYDAFILRDDDTQGYQFKTEQLGGPEHPEHGGAIDLERNDLYDDED